MTSKYKQYSDERKNILLDINNMTSKYLILKDFQLMKIPLQFLKKIRNDLIRTYNEISKVERYIVEPYISPNKHDATAET